MGQLEDLKLFVTIVEQGSITKAAETMDVAKSAVSRRLGLLESRYDLKLLQRNASKPSVTRDGMAFYQRALHVLREFSEFQAEFSDHKSNLHGPLRITVPHDFGQYYLNNVLERFQSKYPNIHLTVNFLDRSVDLVHENYDFALRIAPEMDENLKGEQLAEITHSLVASPRYLAGLSKPLRIETLTDQRILHYGSERRAELVLHHKSGVIETVRFSPAMNSNSGSFLLDACLNHQGITRLPHFMSETHLKTGALVEVLPSYSLQSSNLTIVYSSERRLTARMRLLLKELKEECEAMDFNRKNA